jgi:hypothetical protein
LRRIGKSAFALTAIQTFYLPGTVEELGSRAFMNCRELAEFIFGQGSVLKVLGNATFVGSGLSAITIPASVEVIEKGCFCQCMSLLSIEFEEGSRLERIGEFAFLACPIENLSIPPKVGTIEAQAFCGCSQLRVLKFEGVVDVIGKNAFSGPPLRLLKVPVGVNVGLHFPQIGVGHRCRFVSEGDLLYAEFKSG